MSTDSIESTETLELEESIVLVESIEIFCGSIVFGLLVNTLTIGDLDYKPVYFIDSILLMLQLSELNY